MREPTNGDPEEGSERGFAMEACLRSQTAGLELWKIG